MTLHTMTVPDDPSELPRWLERRFVAPDFGRFIAELVAHFPAASDSPPSRQVLDKWLPVAMEEGLEPLPPDVLNQLLRHPATLAAFQERIVTDGGAYWDEVLDRSDELSAAFERGKRSLEEIVSADRPRSRKRTAPNVRPELRSKTDRSAVAKQTAGRGYKVWALASTGVAACLAVAIGVMAARGPDEPPVPKSQIAWGWGKPSGLAADQSTAKAYLNKLAANAEEWSLHQPTDAAGVGMRIAEFRSGCTRLMHSPYGPLVPADRDWLLEHCREWARILDAHQQALDNGADPLTVRADVDETARKIATTLREKARQVG